MTKEAGKANATEIQHGKNQVPLSKGDIAALRSSITLGSIKDCGADARMEELLSRAKHLSAEKQELLLKMLEQLEAEDHPVLQLGALEGCGGPEATAAEAPQLAQGSPSLSGALGTGAFGLHPTVDDDLKPLMAHGRCGSAAASGDLDSAASGPHIPDVVRICDPALVALHQAAQACQNDSASRLPPRSRQGSTCGSARSTGHSSPFSSNPASPMAPGFALRTGLDISPLAALPHRERGGSLPPLENSSPAGSSATSPVVSQMTLFMAGVSSSPTESQPRPRAGSLPPLPTMSSPSRAPSPASIAASSARLIRRPPQGADQEEAGPPERRRHSLFMESSLWPLPSPSILSRKESLPGDSFSSFPDPFSVRLNSSRVAVGRKSSGDARQEPTAHCIDPQRPKQPRAPREPFKGREGAPASSTESLDSSLSGASSPEAGSPSALMPGSVSPRKEAFRIPLSPKGRRLTINILSTWGDPHYVGLTGLEVFDEDGRCVSDPSINGSITIQGNPHSINILPEYRNDPRVPANLLDGVNRTCDDIHMWLAPFSEGRAHFLHVDLGRPTTLSMLRLWNYNKSRIHSYRGARYMEVTLDQVPIFKGEVQKAPGAVDTCGTYAECILFSLQEIVFAAIDLHDKAKETLCPEDLSLSQRHFGPRPRTATRRLKATASSGPLPSRPALGRNVQEPDSEVPTAALGMAVPTCCELVAGERPMTSAASARRPASALGDSFMSTMGLSPAISEHQLPKGKTVTIRILSTWGDPYYAGLTSLEILDQFQQPFELAESMVSASPKDVTVLSEHASDPRVLSNLFNGWNSTTDRGRMWCIPLGIERQPYIQVHFPKEMKISGVRFWNYNPSLEESFSGVKQVEVLVDGRRVSPDEGCCIRKAPGHTDFDFEHTVFLGPRPHSLRGSLGSSVMHHTGRFCPKAPMERGIMDCETPLFPAAYVFKLEILSTHGDPYYVGLDGLELYDVLNERIELTASNLKAIPQDITVLEESRGDPRTLEKLVDGVNEGVTDDHVWLAPYFSGKPNRLYLIFEEPVAISLIKLWNYSKTVARGAKDLLVFADDVLVYSGALPRADRCPSGRALLFTDDEVVIEKYAGQAAAMQSERGSGIAMYNNGKRIDIDSSRSSAPVQFDYSSIVRPVTRAGQPSR